MAKRSRDTLVKQIEYFYSGHSAFAYLGSKRLSEICAAQGWSIIHRPFDFWPVIRVAAGPDFKVRSAAHMSYFFGRELTRWAEWRDLPILSYRPTCHDNPLALPNGVIIAAADAGCDVDGLSFDILQAHWRDGADIADGATLIELTKKRCMDGEDLIDAAMSDGVQKKHAANTAEAIERNVFGSPTYFVVGDMFYGQDHLDMVERAMQTPFLPEAIN